MLGLSDLKKFKKKKKVRETSDLCTIWVGENSRCDPQVGSQRALGQSCRQRPSWGLVRAVSRRPSRRSFASAAPGDSLRAEVKPRSAARLPRAPPSPPSFPPLGGSQRGTGGAQRAETRCVGGWRPQREKLRRPRVAAAGY